MILKKIIKKIGLSLLVGVIGSQSIGPISSIVFANEENSNQNKNLIGSSYETYKKPIIELYKSNEVYIPNEVKEDIKGLSNINFLKLKTNSNYEVVLAYKDGKYTYLGSEQTLDKAITKAKSSVSKYTVSKDVIPAVINKDGLVVYAAKSIGRIVKVVGGKVSNSTQYVVKVYKNADASKKEYTAINPSYIDDVPIIEEKGTMVKIQVSGYIGWIERSDAEGVNIIEVPMNQVKNLSYYQVSNGELVHYISSNVTSLGAGNTLKIGPAPSFLKPKVKYYSYDGIYFYQNLDQLLSDAKSNCHDKAVNSSKPYYNYYLYLPGRSQVSYSAADLNHYLRDKNNTPADSVLRDKGKVLIAAEKNYGVNASIILGIAMNESAKGTSYIAKKKNNIFGLNAVDKNSGNADTFTSVEACINEFAKSWMSNQYLNPKSWKYNGSNLGNKGIGTNVRYAADPYWGEKAVSFMYGMDKYLRKGTKLIEYNKYKLGMYIRENQVIRKSDRLPLYEVIKERINNGKGPSAAQIGDTIIKLSEINGMYEIYPDRTMPLNQTNPNPGYYDWNVKAYINSNAVKLINNVNDKAPIIKAKDISIKEGDRFNPKHGISAVDKEDGVITGRIEVIQNTVNTKKAGKYKVIYRVTDSGGNNVTKQIKVTVVDKTPPKVFGVSDKKTYKKGVKITFNEGTAKLDRKKFKNGSTVIQKGKHTLIVIDAASNKTTVHFRIK